MAKGWAGAGAWAADLERAEAEEKEKQAMAGSFPRLRESAARKPKKKKKGQTFSLSELASGLYVGPGGRNRAEARGLTTDELSQLPTGPAERSGEEPDRGEPRESRRDSNRRPFGGSRAGEFDQPSRADGAESWAAGKKFVPSDSPNRNRREADGVDNWSVGKKLGGPRLGASGRADNTDRWTRRDRPRIFLNPPSRTRTDYSSPGAGSAAPGSRSNPFGSARPRETVLAERGQDWRKMDAEIDSRSPARPRSSEHSSRPTSLSLDSERQPVPRPRARVNPFGDARPREVLLEEKGKDWRKMDFELEHLAVDRPETEEEHKLKEEINALKKLANETISSDEVKVNRSASGESSIEENQTLRGQIILKEKQLERLIRELDDKVRFGQRGGDRPGSAAGRSFEYVERASFRSGCSDGGLSHDSFERPRSRGGEIRGADVWVSSSEYRRGIHDNQERSFTDTDRFSQGDLRC